MKLIMRRRLLLLTICLSLAVSLIGIMGPSRVLVGTRRKLDRYWLILTGRLVDVGGYRLHIERKGRASPVAVMEAGLCQSMKTWGLVPSEVAKFTTVVTYDRAGLGRSDRGPTPRTSQVMVEELHRLLAGAGIPPPYIMIGHSFGGFNVRLYAGKYPNEVTGIVLVDALHEDRFSRFAPLMDTEERESYLRHEGGENCEKVNILASADQIRAAGPLGHIQLTVLSAGADESPNDARREQARRELQAKLALLVPAGLQTIVENSGHFIQQDRPEVLVDAIRKVVEKASPMTGAWSFPGEAVFVKQASFGLLGSQFGNRAIFSPYFLYD